MRPEGFGNLIKIIHHGVNVVLQINLYVYMLYYISYIGFNFTAINNAIQESHRIIIFWHSLNITISIFVRYEVFTAVTMKNGVFLDDAPCGSCTKRRFLQEPRGVTSQKTPFLIIIFFTVQFSQSENIMILISVQFLILHEVTL
jgi:hypothetical protein